MPDFFQTIPNSGKNRPQQPSDGHFPHQRPGKKAKRKHKPQVAAADSEAQNQPQPGGDQKEDSVSQSGAAAAQGPQKAVDQSQNQPQQAAVQKPLGRQCRRRHPKSRCRQPPLPLRGSS